MYTGLVFLDLRTFRAGQRLLPRDLTGNRIPAIILSLSRKPGPGFSQIRHLLFDSRFTREPGTNYVNISHESKTVGYSEHVF